MKKHVLFLLLAMSTPLFAQNTIYTTTQDGCGGKAFQYCTLNVNGGNPADGPFDVIINSTANYGGRITVQQGVYPNQVNIVDVTGLYTGLVGNPDGTRNLFNGIASFESVDGKVSASLQFYAYYASTCSGRGCGGTLGWHFRVLTGSAVTAQ